MGYMLSRREEQTENLPRLFGMVGIGRYVRFFELRQTKAQLDNYRGGLTYHLDNDNVAIEQTILAMKRYIVRYR